MKSSTLILIVALAAIVLLSSFSQAPAAAEAPAGTPVRIHQPSAIDEGIGLAPAPACWRLASTFQPQLGSAC